MTPAEYQRMREIAREFNISIVTAVQSQPRYTRVREEPPKVIIIDYLDILPPRRPKQLTQIP
jgi:hypothetical protein